MKAKGSMQNSKTAIAAFVVAALGLVLSAAPAAAKAPITYYSTVPSTTQAGGHPDLEVWFEVKNRVTQQSQSACNCEDAKNAAVHLPAGFIGNPHATPQCSIADFSSDECPVDSQVGIVHVCVAGGTCFDSAIYNLVPPPNVAGELGFKIFVFDTPQFTVLSGRTGGDYGLDATATSIFHGLGVPLTSYQEELWGVPAVASHNPLRLSQGVVTYSGDLCDASGSFSTADPNTIAKPCVTNGTPPSVSSNSPLTPFLQNPTNCEASTSSLDVLSYDGGSDHADFPWPPMTGCDQLSFNPSLYAKPTTNETDTASGIDVNLTVPQQLSPSIPSPTELRGATVTLPEGFSINSSAASGKTACTDTAASFGTTEAANCPEFSKVGSLEIDSSALPGPLPGFVYLGQPLPGNRYRIFLVADGFATHVKLAGVVTPNPTSGQLTITFTNLPQSPLTAFNMHFFGSERGLLATPSQCGTYPVQTVFSPWDSALAPQASTQFFILDSGPNGTPCPGARRSFALGFQAESDSNTAGAHSPLSLDLTREDGEQNLAGITVTNPPGLTATLAGIPYCSDASLAAAAEPSYSGLEEEANPSCPLASQIGTSVVGAGAGTHPLFVPGKVYLAGPYRGAPLSIAVITPALSGPYDLGNVIVRVALHVDPADAHITAVSDPLPQILQGIPLRLREIRVSLNREGFALNPTNCSPFQVKAAVLGDQGSETDLSNRYQVANCSILPFAPKLVLRTLGATRRAGNPALHAVLTATPGEANLSRSSVTLPSSEFIDNAHLQTPCTRVQYAAQRCPPGSEIGFAKAETPLLEKPLKGPVYLRSSTHQLPDVVAALRGQISIDLVGHVESIPGRLRTTFETIPDAPISRFVLDLDGGRKGLFENSIPLCSAPQKVLVQLIGQNGATYNRNQALQSPCGSKRRHSHLRRARKAS